MKRSAIREYYHGLFLHRSGQRLDGDQAAICDLQSDAGAVQQGHADERAPVRRQDDAFPELAIPEYRGGKRVQSYGVPIPQDDLRYSLIREPQARNLLQRQGEKAVEARIEYSLDRRGLALLIAQGERNDRLPVGRHLARDHDRLTRSDPPS